MTTGRSPNYPSMSLRDAIERVRPLYQSVHTRAADREVVAQNLGYKGLNGRSLTLIATLLRYGLLEKEGKGRLRISDRAVSILELGKGAPERVQAVSAAAFEPAIFAHINESFGPVLPRDDAFKHFLIKKDFLPAAADEINRIYRENIELVSEENEEYDQPMTPPPALRSATKDELNRALNPQSYPATLGDELRLKISRDTEARIFFTGEVTQEAIDKLAALLQLQKDSYPKQVELDAKEIERIADSN